MRQVLIGFIGFLVLGLSEYLVYHLLRKHGIPGTTAVVVTLSVCLGVFAVFGAVVFVRNSRTGSALDPRSSGSNSTFARDQRGSGSNTTVSKTPSSASNLTVQGGVCRSPSGVLRTGDLDLDDGFAEVATQGVPNPIATPTHENSDAFRDELEAALDSKRTEISALLAEAGTELSRFDVGVLKTLERNSPGSVEGVVIARKIFNALEQRSKEIERFLGSLPITNPEKGKQLLLGDLHIPEDNKLTALFQTKPIPPIKMTEVEFQLRVFLKRISRRRSIFRGSVKDLLEGMGGDSAQALPVIRPAEAARSNAAKEDSGLRHESEPVDEEVLPGETVPETEIS